jgi:hypothetical protein
MSLGPNICEECGADYYDHCTNLNCYVGWANDPDAHEEFPIRPERNMKKDKPAYENADRWASASTVERMQLLQMAELEGRQAALAGLPGDENYYGELEGKLRAAWDAGWWVGARERMGMRG